MESSTPDGYTCDWTDPKDSDSIQSYRVERFRETTEGDFGFPESIPEMGLITIDEENPDPYSHPDDRVGDQPLGESNVELSSEWIRKQMADGTIPLMPSGSSGTSVSWLDFRTMPEIEMKRRADGKVMIRVCQDFRKLNAATKKDHNLLPIIDMVLDHVARRG